MDCSQTGYDSIPGSSSIPKLRKHSHKCVLDVFLSVSWIEREDESNHGELAPGGPYGSVLDHDAIVWFGTPGIGVFIRVVVQGLLLVVLVQLLLCKFQDNYHVGERTLHKK